MYKLGFLELSHIFTNQIKLPYSTGCVWSYCRTIDEISNNFSFDVHTLCGTHMLVIVSVNLLKK